MASHFASRGAALLALSSAFASLAAAQGGLQVVSSGASSTAMSRDGSALLGYDANGPFLWRAASGVTAISGGTMVMALSGDGQVVAGTATDPALQVDNPALWRAAGGWSHLGGIGGSTVGCPDLGTPWAIDDDGSTVVGLAWNACVAQPFRWDQGSQMIQLAKQGPNARANAVSGDGRWIGGWDEDPTTGAWRACRWDANGVQDFPRVRTADPVGIGNVWGFSTDGTYYCGEDSEGAFVAGPQGVISIGALLQDPSSYALGVSDDGGVVVGTLGSGPWAIRRGWIWTRGGGVVMADDLALRYGWNVPTGLAIERLDSISRDGRRCSGSGLDSNWNGYAFVIDLPQSWTDLGSALAGTLGAPLLQGSGYSKAGFGAGVELSNVAANGVALLVASLQSTPIPVFGGTLVAFPPDVTVALLTDASGYAALSWTWPAPDAPAGAALYLQALLPDGGAPQGFAFSNALRANF
ncbi:MAG: hypothetical protein JNM84_13545 [Planctomycetes bacterium]|nr:hypothetical protein [Planctomycetota bacterium]